MGKMDLEQEMRRRVRLFSMRTESSKSDLVVAKVVFNHYTRPSPFTNRSFIFCYLEEITLSSERIYGTSFRTAYFAQSIEGLIDSYDRYRFNEGIASNSISIDLECGRSRKNIICPFEERAGIFSFFYTKEHLEKNVNLSLFYLEELGFQWIESFHDDILSFTLVKNT